MDWTFRMKGGKKILTVTLRFWSEPGSHYWNEKAEMVQSAAWPPLLCLLNLAALATLKHGAVGGAAPLRRGCKGVTSDIPTITRAILRLA